MESFSFTESSSQSHSVEVASGFGFYGGSAGLNHGTSHIRGSGSSSGRSRTVSNSTERVVQVAREVIVPPYTSVTVCSTISSNDNFTTKFTARSEFSSPGLSGAEVEAYLRARKVEGPFNREGDIVSKRIRGDISLSLPLDTQFIVSPHGAIDGCGSLKENLKRKKYERVLSASKRIKARYSNVG